MKTWGGKPIFTVEFNGLNRLYIIEHLSINQIARLLGVSYSTILRQLQKYDIPRRGRGDAHKGKIVSQETRAMISEGNKGNTKWLGKHHSPETLVRLSKYRTGKAASEEIKTKMSASHKRRWQNPALKLQVSEAHKRNWRNPEYRDKVVRNTALAQNVHPNRKEAIILGILSELGLEDWAFTDTGEYSYGGKRPDFMDITREDKIIEMFGDYWHIVKVRCYEETEEGRIAHFAKYGKKTLIIWESELMKQPDKVKAKIAVFVGTKY